MNRPGTPPALHNDDLIDQTSRRVFMKAIAAAEKLLDEGGSTERIHAIAALADAAGCGFKPEDNDDNESYG